MTWIKILRQNIRPNMRHINKGYLFKHCWDTKCTYPKHFFVSTNLAIKFGSASLKAFSHALLPNTYTTSSQDAVKELVNLLEKSPCKKKNSSY